MGGEIRIYPSRIQDPKKNPLDVNKKISYLKKMFPDFAEDIVNNPDINTIFDVLIAANEDGYMNVNIVVGSDRQSEMQSLAAKHNGQLYEFTEIKVIPAGNFDAEKDAVGGVTSSMMRRTASENNYREFAKGVSKVLDETDIRKLFNDVRKGMGLNSKMKEHYEIWEIAPDLDFKNLRENYIQNNIFRLGDKVQNLNTGLIGEVMRRGTNYLICVTEDNVMFKSWISDLMEYNEVKMDSMYRLPKKPNTLVGTTGYLKYAIKQTPGSTLGRENLQSGGKSFLDFINKYKKKKVSA